MIDYILDMELFQKISRDDYNKCHNAHFCYLLHKHKI